MVTVAALSPRSLTLRRTPAFARRPYFQPSPLSLPVIMVSCIPAQDRAEILGKIGRHRPSARRLQETWNLERPHSPSRFGLFQFRDALHSSFPPLSLNHRRARREVWLAMNIPMFLPPDIRSESPSFETDSVGRTKPGP